MNAGHDGRRLPLFLTEAVMLEWEGETHPSDALGFDAARPWEPLWLVKMRATAREMVRLKNLFGEVTP